MIPQWSVAGPGQLVIPVEVKIGTQDSSCAATVVTDSESCWDDASQLIDGIRTQQLSLLNSQIFNRNLWGYSLILKNFSTGYNTIFDALSMPVGTRGLPTRIGSENARICALGPGSVVAFHYNLLFLFLFLFISKSVALFICSYVQNKQVVNVI